MVDTMVALMESEKDEWRADKMAVLMVELSVYAKDYPTVDSLD